MANLFGNNKRKTPDRFTKINALTYARNVGKSFGYAFIDNFNNMAPTTAALLKESNDLKNEMFANISSFKSKATDFDKSGTASIVLEGAKDFRNNLVADIRNGTWYNKQRIEKANDEIASDAFGISLDDFGDFDSDFDFDTGDDMDFDTDVTVSAEEANAKAISSAVSEASQRAAGAVSMATAQSAEYVVTSNRANTKALYNGMTSGFGKINVGLAAINTNISALMELGKPLTDHMQNSSKFYIATSQYQEKSLALLEQIAKNTTPPEIKRKAAKKGTTINDLVTADGLLDISAYKDFVQTQFKDMTSMFTSSLDMIGGAKNGMKMLTASPGQLILPFLTGQLFNIRGSKTNRTLKQAISGFDKALSGMATGLMAKAKATDFSGMGMIGELLNVLRDNFIPNSGLKTKINTGNYVKGRVDWTGKADKALREVIPTQLGKILSAITGEQARTFDYETGKWVPIKDIETDAHNRKMRAARSAGGDFFSDIKSSVNKSNMTKKGKDAYNEQVDAFLMKMMMNDSQDFIKLTDDRFWRERGSEYKDVISEKVFKDFQKRAKAVARRNPGSRSELASNFYSARASYGRGTENSDNLEYMLHNGSMDFGNKQSMGFRRLDEFDKDNLFYLRGIYTYTGYLANNFKYLIPGVDTGGFNSNMVILEGFPDPTKSNNNIGKVNNKAKKKSAPRGNMKMSSDVEADLDAVYKYNEDTDDDAFLDSLGDELREYYEKSKRGEVDKDPTKDNKIGLARSAYKRKNDVRGKLGNAYRKIADSDSRAGKILSAFENTLDVTTDSVSDMLDSVSRGINDFVYGKPGQEKGTSIADTVKTGLRSITDALVDNVKVFLPDFVVDFATSIWKSINENEHVKNFKEKTKGALKNAAKWFVPQKVRDFFSGKEEEPQSEEAAEGASGSGLFGSSLFNTVYAAQNSIFTGFAGGASKRNGNNTKSNTKTKSEYNSSKKKNRKGKRQSRSGANTSKVNAGADDDAAAADDVIERASDKIAGFMTDKLSGFIADHNPKTEKETIQNNINNMLKEADIGAMGAGAVIGGGLSLVTGAFLGPIAAAGVGAAIGFVSKSNTAQELLFGKLTTDEDGNVTREGGIVKKDLANFITKNVPSMAKGGGIGAVAGTFLGSPLLGSIVGAGIGFVSSSENAKKTLFGDLVEEVDENGNTHKVRAGGLVSKKIQDMVKKGAFGASAGAAAGLLIGPFGPVGNLMVGSALGFASTTDKFQKWFFGDKDENGKFKFGKGGFSEKIRKEMFEPIVGIFDKLSKRITEQIKELGHTFKKWLKQFILKKVLGGLAGWIFGKAKIGRAIASAGKKVATGAWNIITKPGQMINNALERGNLAKGYGIENTTSVERNLMRAGFKVQEDGSVVDRNGNLAFNSIQEAAQSGIAAHGKAANTMGARIDTALQLFTDPEEATKLRTLLGQANNDQQAQLSARIKGSTDLYGQLFKIQREDDNKAKAASNLQKLFANGRIKGTTEEEVAEELRMLMNSRNGFMKNRYKDNEKFSEEDISGLSKLISNANKNIANANTNARSSVVDMISGKMREAGYTDAEIERFTKGSKSDKYLMRMASQLGVNIKRMEKDGAKTVDSVVIDTIPGLLQNIKNAITEGVSTITQDTKTGVTKLATGIERIYNHFRYGKMGDAMNDLYSDVGDVAGTVSRLPGDLFNLGKTGVKGVSDATREMYRDYLTEQTKKYQSKKAARANRYKEHTDTAGSGSGLFGFGAGGGKVRNQFGTLVDSNEDIASQQRKKDTTMRNNALFSISSMGGGVSSLVSGMNKIVSGLFGDKKEKKKSLFSKLAELITGGTGLLGGLLSGIFGFFGGGGLSSASGIVGKVLNAFGGKGAFSNILRGALIATVGTGIVKGTYDTLANKLTNGATGRGYGQMGTSSNASYTGLTAMDASGNMVAVAKDGNGNPVTDENGNYISTNGQPLDPSTTQVTESYATRSLGKRERDKIGRTLLTYGPKKAFKSSIAGFGVNKIAKSLKLDKLAGTKVGQKVIGAAKDKFNTLLGKGIINSKLGTKLAGKYEAKVAKEAAVKRAKDISKHSVQKAIARHNRKLMKRGSEKLVSETTQSAVKKITKQTVNETTKNSVYTGIKEGLTKAFNKICTVIPKFKGKQKALAGVADDIAEAAAKKAAKQTGEAAAKIAAKVAAGFVWFTKIAFVISDFWSGYEDATTTWKVKKASTSQKLISGLLRVVLNLNPLIGMLLPDSVVMDILIDGVAPILGINVREVKSQRAAAEEELREYNEANGTNYSWSEYNKQVLGNYTTGEKIGNWFKNAFTGVKNVFTGGKKSSKATQKKSHDTGASGSGLLGYTGGNSGRRTAAPSIGLDRITTGVGNYLGNDIDSKSMRDLSKMYDDMEKAAKVGNITGVTKASERTMKKLNAKNSGMSRTFGIISKLGMFAYTSTAMMNKFTAKDSVVSSTTSEATGTDDTSNGKGKSSSKNGKGILGTIGGAIISLGKTISGWFAGKGSGLTGYAGGSSEVVSQLDSKYSNISVGGKSMAENGCGPASAVMALDSLGKSSSVSSAASIANNYQVTGGTDASYFRDMFSRNGVDSSYVQGDGVKSAVASGNPVVLMGQDSSNTSKANSPFGPNNHYVVANGYDSNGNVNISDPETGNHSYSPSILDNVKIGIAASGSRRRKRNNTSSRANHAVHFAASGSKKNNKTKGGALPMTMENCRKENLGVWSEPTVEELNAFIKKKNPTSPFNGHGDVFIRAGKASGLDPRYILAHAAFESAWGTSKICREKNNYFGIAAFDSNPYNSAKRFGSGLEAGIIGGACWIAEHYYHSSYDQTCIYKMRWNNNVHQYATDPKWDTKIAGLMATMPANTKLTLAKGVKSTVLSSLGESGSSVSGDASGDATGSSSNSSSTGLVGSIINTFSNAFGKVFGGNEESTDDSSSSSDSGSANSADYTNSIKTATTAEGKALANSFINKAASKMDYVEGAGNDTMFGKFMGVNKAPWCASFVSWAMSEAAGGKDKAAIPLRGPVSASVDGLWSNFKSHNAMTSNPAPGDIVIYKNGTSHTGLVEKVEGNKITTIEGNTSGGNGFSRNGGMVARKTFTLGDGSYKAKHLTGFGRPDWDNGSTAAKAEKKKQNKRKKQMEKHGTNVSTTKQSAFGTVPNYTSSSLGSNMSNYTIPKVAKKGGKGSGLIGYGGGASGSTGRKVMLDSSVFSGAISKAENTKKVGGRSTTKTGIMTSMSKDSAALLKIIIELITSIVQNTDRIEGIYSLLETYCNRSGNAELQNAVKEQKSSYVPRETSSNLDSLADLRRMCDAILAG